MCKDFLAIVENRRSIYGLSKEAVLADDEIIALVHRAVKAAPSAFNSQSARLLVLLGDEHDKVWEITKDALRKIIPGTLPENRGKTRHLSSGNRHNPLFRRPKHRGKLAEGLPFL